MTTSVSQPLVWYGILIGNICTLYARPDRVCSTYSERPHRNGICGRNIPDTLSLLCNGSYNDPFTIYDHHYTGILYPGELPRPSRLEGILLGRRTAMSYLYRKRQSRPKRDMGIVCECCYNQCDMNELSEYCKKD